jgi:hypothetical protein
MKTTLAVSVGLLVAMAAIWGIDPLLVSAAVVARVLVGIVALWAVGTLVVIGVASVVLGLLALAELLDRIFSS